MEQNEDTVNELAARMKEYEKDNEVFGASTLKQDKPFIIRLDGHKFSKFTTGFKKPYDERIYKAMLLSTKDLMEEFQALLGYTQSDEITLVFPALTSSQIQAGDVLKYNGRIQKLISLASGFCSVRFAYHLCTQPFDSVTEKNLVEKIHKAYFDARVFHIPTPEEAINNIIWRISDVKRNGVNNLGFCNFRQKDLEGLSPKQVIEKLQSKGIEWSAMPANYKYGVILKKSKFDYEGFNPLTNEKVVVPRTKMCFCSLDSVQLKDATKLVTEKVSNDCGEFHKYFQEIEFK